MADEIENFLRRNFPDDFVGLLIDHFDVNPAGRLVHQKLQAPIDDLERPVEPFDHLIEGRLVHRVGMPRFRAGAGRAPDADRPRGSRRARRRTGAGTGDAADAPVPEPGLTAAPPDTGDAGPPTGPEAPTRPIPSMRISPIPP